jgi:preprotein translocase subunit SecE
MAETMNEVNQQAPAGSGGDTAKLVVAVLLVFAGIAGYYVLGAQPDWQRWSAMVAGLVLAAVVFWSSQSGRNFGQFFFDSRIELRKVVWPSRDQAIKTTMIVFGFMVLAGLFFWVLDWFLALATKYLTGQGG